MGVQIFLKFADAILALLNRAGAGQLDRKYVDVVFDGDPGAEAPRFVEVENASRASVNFGEWVKRDDGYWVLRIFADRAPDGMEAMRKKILASTPQEPKFHLREEGYATGWVEGIAAYRQMIRALPLSPQAAVEEHE